MREISVRLTLSRHLPAIQEPGALVIPADRPPVPALIAAEGEPAAW